MTLRRGIWLLVFTLFCFVFFTSSQKRFEAKLLVITTPYADSLAHYLENNGWDFAGHHHEDQVVEVVVRSHLALQQLQEIVEPGAKIVEVIPVSLWIRKPPCPLKPSENTLS